MSIFRRSPASKINPAELKQKAQDSLDRTQKQQHRVNVLTTYLNARKNQNGFGEDFEYTLRPRRW